MGVQIEVVLMAAGPYATAAAAWVLEHTMKHSHRLLNGTASTPQLFSKPHHRPPRWQTS